MSAEPSAAYEEMRRFRKTERAQLVETLRDLIEETRKRAKSHYTSSKERARWVRLAGQLVWYKDQVLRSLSFEALEEEVAQLKAILKETSTPPEQTVQRRVLWKGPPETKPNTRHSPTKQQNRKAGSQDPNPSRASFPADKQKRAQNQPKSENQQTRQESTFTPKAFPGDFAGPEKARSKPRTNRQARKQPIPRHPLPTKKDTFTTHSRHVTRYFPER